MDSKHMLIQEPETSLDADTPNRKLYHSPQLTEWGTLSELTQSLDTGSPDATIGGSRSFGF
jgi:hypothetical protein